jgi:tetratricopeptide (TPR) repeat protein
MGDSCPRCGVVFAKLGTARPEKPREPVPRPEPPPAAPEGKRFSGFNVAALSLLLTLCGALALQHFEGARGPDPEAVEGGRGRGREVVVEVPSPPGYETLVVPRPGPAPAPAGGEASGTGRELPSLPELNEQTVNQALIERAVSLAREFPDEPGLREYVSAAHLLLAGKAMRERRFDEALRLVGRAEEWGASSGQTATFRAVIYGQLESWDAAEKWARTALAYGARDNAAEMHHLIGKAFYFREELPEAIAEFRQALRIKNDPAIRASLERAELEARTSSGFDRRRLSHFIVTYEGSTMENTGRMVLDTMERSYSALVSQFGFEPEEPVVVILYSGRSYLEMGGPHWSAGMFDGKIRVPVAGLERLDQHIQTTLHHELAHAFVHARGGGSVPRWLHEGVAEHMEGVRSVQHGKFLASILNQGRTLDACLSTANCDVEVFYPAAASLVDFMVQSRGMGGIRDVLVALGRGGDVDSALRGVYGRDEAELFREWQHFVKRRFS